jgi:hypothetical protein
MEALAEAGGVHRELMDQWASEEEADREALGTFVKNAMLVGATDKLSGFFEIGGKTLSRMARGFATEAAQEAGQSMISQEATTGQIDFKAAAYEGLIGGIVGGGAGGVISLLDKQITPKTDEGFSEDSEITVGDHAQLREGQTVEEYEEEQRDRALKLSVQTLMEENQAKIDADAEFQAAKEEREYIEKVQAEKEQAAFAAAENEKQQNEQFIDSIGTKQGLIDTVGRMIAPLEESENPDHKRAAKPLRDAHKALHVGDLASTKIRGIQWELKQLAMNTENVKIGGAAMGLNNQLDIEMEMAEEREAEIEAAKEFDKEVEKTRREKLQAFKSKGAEATKAKQAAKETAETKVRTKKLAPKLIKRKQAEEKISKRTKPELAKVARKQRVKKGAARRIKAETKKAAETAMPRLQYMKNKKEVQDAKKRIDKVAKFSRTDPEVFELINTPYDKLTSTQKLQIRYNDYVRKGYSRKHNISEEELRKKPLPKFSKQDEMDNATHSTAVVNKEAKGFVRYDGPWKDMGGQQFTTTQAIGNMEAGQTFLIKDGKVTPTTIKEKVDKLLKSNHVSISKNPIKLAKVGPTAFYTKQYVIKETGDKVKVKIDAQQALEGVDNDLFSLKVLRDCI